MRLLVIRLAVALSAVAVALGTKAVLDATVAPYPWFVVTFIAVLVATLAGRVYAGVVATLGLVVAEVSGLSGPPVGGSNLENASLAIDFVSGLLAVLTGEIVRVTGDRAERSAVTAERATRTSEDVDRRWHVVTRAVPIFATLGSTLQVKDALIRYASELTGEPMILLEGAADWEAGHPVRADASRRDLEWGAADRAGLAALSTLAAGAIGRIRLEAASGISIESAERTGLQLQRLHAVTTRLAALVTPEEIGEVIVAHVLDLLRAPVGLFYLTDAAGDLRLAHARGYPMGLAGHDARLRPTDALPAADALREGRPVVVATPADWRERYPGASDRLGMTGTRSVIAWPIGTPPQAVLVVQRTVEGQPSPDELGQLEVAGHQATQAIERARIYAQEREARQLQEAFVGVMSHELRTPITTILAGSKLLLRDRDMADRSRDLATDIEAEADRLFRLVEDLLVLSRLERGSLSVGDEPVHVVRVLQRVIASESTRWPLTDFEVNAQRGGHLARGDETYVEQVLRNLLTNAAKYSPPRSTVQVRVELADGDIVVRVLDEGSGVTEAEVERLFGLFYRSPTTAASAAGAGIGLFVCRRLITAMGGRIWARPRGSGGSEFGFSLARYPEALLPDTPPDAASPTEQPTSARPSTTRRLPPATAGVAGTDGTVDNGSSTGGEAR